MDEIVHKSCIKNQNQHIPKKLFITDYVDTVNDVKVFYYWKKGYELVHLGVKYRKVGNGEKEVREFRVNKIEIKFNNRNEKEVHYAEGWKDLG